MITSTGKHRGPPRKPADLLQSEKLVLSLTAPELTDLRGLARRRGAALATIGRELVVEGMRRAIAGEPLEWTDDAG